MNFDASKRKSMTKQGLLVGLVLIVGAVLGGTILTAKKSEPAGEGPGAHAEGAKDEHDHDKGQRAVEAGTKKKGPHGGRLFTENGYGLELTIFEAGVEPQFRLYTYKDGKAIDPAQSQVTLTLERLGRKPQEFTFTKEADYLKGSAVVEEPHSFDVKISAQHAGKAYRFAFEQVEARVTMSDAQAKGGGVEVAAAGPASSRWRCNCRARCT